MSQTNQCNSVYSKVFNKSLRYRAPTIEENDLEKNTQPNIHQEIDTFYIMPDDDIDTMEFKTLGLKILRDLEILKHSGAYQENYDPNQPRVPAGSREGGQWTNNEPSANKPSINKALATLRRKALPGPNNECATFVRIALESGGFKIKKTHHAKDYGHSLIKAGFEEVVLEENEQYIATRGDVAIIQPYPGGNPSGHMQMYDGQNWISDWVQRRFWPGQGYGVNKPPFKIYRYPSVE